MIAFFMPCLNNSTQIWSFQLSDLAMFRCSFIWDQDTDINLCGNDKTGKCTNANVMLLIRRDDIRELEYLKI